MKKTNWKITLPLLGAMGFFVFDTLANPLVVRQVVTSQAGKKLTQEGLKKLGQQGAQQATRQGTQKATQQAARQGSKRAGQQTGKQTKNNNNLAQELKEELAIEALFHLPQMTRHQNNASLAGGSCANLSKQACQKLLANAQQAKNVSQSPNVSAVSHQAQQVTTSFTPSNPVQQPSELRTAAEARGSAMHIMPVAQNAVPGQNKPATVEDWLALSERRGSQTPQVTNTVENAMTESPLSRANIKVKQKAEIQPVQNSATQRPATLDKAKVKLSKFNH